MIMTGPVIRLPVEALQHDAVVVEARLGEHIPASEQNENGDQSDEPM